MLQDFSQYILDIAENSLKADASHVSIEVAEDTERRHITIAVSDNGNGMDVEQLRSVHNPFFTTRTERKVGLGIPFLKQAAELCGGNLEICSTKGKGTILRAVFCSDCIDCPPTGDIASTLVTLFAGWPDRNFSFSYAIDGEKFATGTNELLEALEERELLASPKVAMWFDRFIRDNIEMLRSRRECKP